MARWAPFLNHYLQQAPRNASYLSNRIQNDLVQCVSEVLLKKIKVEIAASRFVAIVLNFAFLSMKV